MRWFLLSSAVVLTLTSAACARQDSATPDATTATAPQTRNSPMTVAGCLRAGEADNTFVLNAAAAEGSPETATYQLVGEAAQLRDHIGRRVEVSGTLTAEQEVRSAGAAVAEEKAKGTAGTPVVETRTKIEVKQLQVSSVRPLGESCER
jgi:hypothetical protein